jgi:hypothetical protein
MINNLFYSIFWIKKFAYLFRAALLSLLLFYIKMCCSTRSAYLSLVQPSSAWPIQLVSVLVTYYWRVLAQHNTTKLTWTPQDKSACLEMAVLTFLFFIYLRALEEHISTALVSLWFHLPTEYSNQGPILKKLFTPLIYKFS